MIFPINTTRHKECRRRPLLSKKMTTFLLVSKKTFSMLWNNFFLFLNFVKLKISLLFLNSQSCFIFTFFKKIAVKLSFSFTWNLWKFKFYCWPFLYPLQLFLCLYVLYSFFFAFIHHFIFKYISLYIRLIPEHLSIHSLCCTWWHFCLRGRQQRCWCWCRRRHCVRHWGAEKFIPKLSH